MKTTVGEFQVEVRGFANPALYYFRSGAHGKKEAGYFAFWTAVLKKPVGAKRKIFGRAQVGLSAGDRFDRMQHEMHEAKDAEDRKVYGRFWVSLCKRGRNVKYIRPATQREVKRWMATHESDAKHAKAVKKP